MRIPANLGEHCRIITEEAIDIDRCFRDFSVAAGEKLLRYYMAPVLKYMPTGLRYAVTDIAKRLRNPSRKVNLNYPMDFIENRKIVRRLKNDLRPWWGKKAVVSISHDVDNDRGYAFVSRMAEMDHKAGIMSAFNFLTHDNYVPDKSVLEHLKGMGMEIGLHGYTHDQGFAFRSRVNMAKQLAAALSALEGLGITGIRTPALSKSRAYFAAIREAGLKYDSSMQIGSGIYQGVRLPYPYYFEEFGIWEIPLMIQDDNYLRDSATNEKDMLSSIIRFIEETIALNGVMVLNMHPHLMCDRSSLYLKVLDALSDYKKEVSFTATGMIYEYAEQQRKENV
ncbi:MAG: hypothetical protein V1874_11360 [Spirochaetota bacterium]